MLYFSALLEMAVENRCHLIDLVCLSWRNHVNSYIQYRTHVYTTYAFACVHVCVFERLKLYTYVCVVEGPPFLLTL
jgi:hypothetical protein